jgi:hypothetical protein
LNAGYKCGQTIPRCTGPNHEVINFDPFCAVALAGIGELPDTIMSRSVIIKMRRRAPTERVESFRARKHSVEGHALRQRLATWADDVGSVTGNAWPELPAGVEDRNHEIWEPLIAVADSAGGDWPDVARTACSALVSASEDRSYSLGVILLRDLKTVFDRSGQQKLSTDYLIDMLTSTHSGLDDDAPWADLHGTGLDPRKLARLLKPYDVKSKKIRMNDVTLQGYTSESLHDAWQRWLPPTGPENVEQTEHAEQPSPDWDTGVPEVPDVPDNQGGWGA